ncbi:hypothetical protein VP1G_02950 [Cytospora mali]|uniref:Uncharacterized protein n=1 Tax=Cytospora mali TaxID=578113 RepID=A0A194UV54_CYTMA|nr:hypothetical protein VP1G_02950 [Valsa mali var. pyri (nom. inval.)]
MGIPYSREIDNAFNQVTPLVAAGFQVLQTTKNISILLAVIQILTCVFLGAILLAIIGLICTVNPGLMKEKDELVTPVVRWLASWVFSYGTTVSWLLRALVVVSTGALGVFFWQGSMAGVSVPGTPEEGDGDKS